MAEQPNKPARLTSLDAYRGFVMLLMVSGGFGIARIVRNHPEVLERFSGTAVHHAWQWLWTVLAYQLDHVEWTGCAFWDLIQPSFMFMVGVSMPFSYARRQQEGHSFCWMLGHAAYRAIILVLLAILLSSNWSKQTNFVFPNVLAQIGLGYAFIFFVLGRGLLVQLSATAAILGGYWWLFYQYAPGETFLWDKMPNRWEYFTGLAAHWNKHANAAAAFDQWFLNLFPQPTFYFNDGGYQTLNFVPSMATMIFGIMAGELLRGERSPAAKLLRLVLGGVLCLSIGLAVDHTVWADSFTNLVHSGVRLAGQDPATVAYLDPNWTLCPIVKRIWTPSWAVFSTGWTLLMLAGFYWLIDMKDYRRWAFPLVVVGMNSIAMYLMAQLIKGWVSRTLQTHLGAHIFDGRYGPLIETTSVLFVLWLFCWYLYRQRIFLRI